MAIYHIFMDEVGNHDMTPANLINERYLTLFGVIIEKTELSSRIEPEMDAIKADIFPQHKSSPVIFHRKEILRQQGAFSILFDPKTRADFDRRLLEGYRKWEYTAIAVCIDKLAHLNKYGEWHYEPYYYCFKTILERYILFLYYRRSVGDVTIESRNPYLDKQLSTYFTLFYEHGTENISRSTWRSRTSRQLKISTKRDNDSGLQLADLLAHPAHYDLLVEYGMVEKQTAYFGSKVSAILHSKYYRNYKTGEIRGCGLKLLP